MLDVAVRVDVTETEWLIERSWCCKRRSRNEVGGLLEQLSAALLPYIASVVLFG